MASVNKEFDPSKYVASYLVRNRLLHGIQQYATRLDGKMLDFGCGSKPYKSLFTVSEYVGLDFHSDGHDHTTEQIDVFYDGITIPFPNEIFDSVFSSEVFEHVFNLEQILLEINRVMKKGGLILITCPFAICEHEQPNDYARYTSFAIKHLMEKNGFEIIAFEKLGTSIDVIVQIRLTYFHNNIMPLISRIPVFRHLVRISVNFILNSYANLHGKVFPRGNELYLNNLILCKKK
jgi:SAM-dependent methyltransferase